MNHQKNNPSSQSTPSISDSPVDLLLSLTLPSPQPEVSSPASAHKHAGVKRKKTDDKRSQLTKEIKLEESPPSSNRHAGVKRKSSVSETPKKKRSSLLQELNNILKNEDNSIVLEEIKKLLDAAKSMQDRNRLCTALITFNTVNRPLSLIIKAKNVAAMRVILEFLKKTMTPEKLSASLLKHMRTGKKNCILSMAAQEVINQQVKDSEMLDLLLACVGDAWRRKSYAMAKVTRAQRLVLEDNNPSILDSSAISDSKAAPVCQSHQPMSRLCPIATAKLTLWDEVKAIFTNHIKTCRQNLFPAPSPQELITFQNQLQRLLQDCLEAKDSADRCIHSSDNIKKALTYKNRCPSSPLLYLARWGYVTVFSYLLELGKVNGLVENDLVNALQTKDENHQSCFYYAIRTENPLFVKLVLEHGGWKNEQTRIRTTINGKTERRLSDTPLQYAKNYNSPVLPVIQEYLLQLLQTDPNSKILKDPQVIEFLKTSEAAADLKNFTAITVSDDKEIGPASSLSVDENNSARIAVPKPVLPLPSPASQIQPSIAEHPQFCVPESGAVAQQIVSVHREPEVKRAMSKQRSSSPRFLLSMSHEAPQQQQIPSSISEHPPFHKPGASANTSSLQDVASAPTSSSPSQFSSRFNFLSVQPAIYEYLELTQQVEQLLQKAFDEGGEGYNSEMYPIHRNLYLNCIQRFSSENGFSAEDEVTMLGLSTKCQLIIERRATTANKSLPIAQSFRRE